MAKEKELPKLNAQAIPQGTPVEAATGTTPDISTKETEGYAERKSIEGKTEGPELDKQEDVDPATQLKELVEKCIGEGMQVHIITQKAGILNATFEKPLDEMDMADLSAYARDRLDEIRRAMSV